MKDTRSLRFSLLAYGVIFTIKLVAYAMTGVLAMLAEALHTVSDVFVTGFLLVAVIYSRKTADEDHMFGHGRAQNVAGLTAAVLFVAFTAYKLYEEAIPRLFEAEEATYENLGLAVGILLASMLIAGFPMARLIREKDRGAASRAQLFALLKDEIGLLAALFATVLIGFGYPIADPIASIVVATIIVWMGVSLFRDNSSMLLGRSPGKDFVVELERVARSVDGVVGVHDIRAEYVGPDTVHAGMHLEVAPGIAVEEVGRITEEVRRRVHEEANTGYCVIEVEAAGSSVADEKTGERVGPRSR